MTEPLLRVKELGQALPGRRRVARARARARARGRRRELRRRARARRWAWSASPAAASRPPGRCILRLIEPTAGEVSVRRAGTSPALGRGAAARAAPRHADHLPGPVRLAQPAHDGRRDRRRGAGDPRARATAPARATGSASCWSAVGLQPDAHAAATRTSSPAGSASASASPARWRSSRS